VSVDITIEGMEAALAAIRDGAPEDAIVGVAIIASDHFPYRHTTKGYWIHGAKIGSKCYASRTLVRLIAGALTFDSALLVAEELANSTEP
jgi:hypothetical protein